MGVDVILKLYQELLNVYTEVVQMMEATQEIARQKHPEMDIRSVPYMVLNSRMFIEDEYLTNNIHRRYCFEEKNKIMPHLVRFLAAYENSVDEQKHEFENRKPKNAHQGYLDELLVGKVPFLKFLEGQLRNQEYQKERLKIPFPPQRKNAIRQLEQYRVDKEAYNEERDIIDRCQQEVKDRIALFKKYSQDESYSS